MSLQHILNEKVFNEPRLIMFKNGLNPQGLIVAEKTELFEVDQFTISVGMISLLAAYYVFYINYPKSHPAAGILMFMQELLLCIPDETTKKSSTYSALIDYLTAD